jgi:putative membrane protein (TIGR04086 family)
MRKINEEDPGALRVRVMTCILLGGIIGLLLCFVFLFLCSAGISIGIIDESLMYQLTIFGCVIGGFTALWAVGRGRSRTLIVGLSVCFIFYLLLFTGGILVFENNASAERWFGLFCGALCGGALAGLLGGKPRKKHK